MTPAKAADLSTWSAIEQILIGERCLARSSERFERKPLLIHGLHEYGSAKSARSE